MKHYHLYFMILAIISGLQTAVIAQNDITLNKCIIQHRATISGIVENDGYYSHRPVNHIIPVAFSGKIVNSGTFVQNDVNYYADVNDSLLNNVFSDSGYEPFIGLTDTLIMDFTNEFLPVAVNNYSATLSCFQTEPDDFPADNVSEQIPLTISEERFISRIFEYNSQFSPVEYGNNSGYAAISFTLKETDTIKSVSVFIDPLTTGGHIEAVIMREETELVEQIMSEELYIVGSTSSGSWYELPLITINPDDDILNHNFRYWAFINIYDGAPASIYLGSDTSGLHDFGVERKLFSGLNIVNSDEVPMIQINLSGYVFPYSVNETENIKSVDIYPNPVDRDITIVFPDFVAEGIVEIFNFTGECIDNYEIKGCREITLDLSNQTSGMYFFRLTGNRNINYTGKFIKN